MDSLDIFDDNAAGQRRTGRYTHQIKGDAIPGTILVSTAGTFNRIATSPTKDVSSGSAGTAIRSNRAMQRILLIWMNAKTANPINQVETIAGRSHSETDSVRGVSAFRMGVAKAAGRTAPGNSATVSGIATVAGTSVETVAAGELKGAIKS
jgi:hypothetical protein